MYVNANGTQTATAMQIANQAIDPGFIESIPGSPPTPIALAVTLIAVLIIPAIHEPVIPQMNGKTYFKLTPNIAGSVTPR